MNPLTWAAHALARIVGWLGIEDAQDVEIEGDEGE